VIAFVTGAAGFLGSHLCDELLERGYKVIGVDNFFRGKEENLPTHPNFTFFEVDLTKKDSIREYLYAYNPEILFHYAAINGTEYFYDIPTKVFNDNIEITKNVLTDIKGSSVKKVVYTSTSEVYGDNPPLPTPESHMIQLNIFSDRDSYASSKAIGEFYIKYYCKEYDMDYLILRPFNTYGPRMDNTKYGQVVPEFFRKLKDKEFTIIGDGTQTRSFCFVDDHKRLAVMLSESVSNDVINIGNDEQVTILELAEKIHKINGVEFNPKFLPPREYDTQRRQPDISKIKACFSQYNFVNLNQGLRKML
jgi:nucleoside-diphosphate-sugar epimerase